jgi:hypothetical protein
VFGDGRKDVDGQFIGVGLSTATNSRPCAVRTSISGILSDGDKFKAAHCCPGKDADVLENDLVAGVRAATTSSRNPVSLSPFSIRSSKSGSKQNIL